MFCMGKRVFFLIYFDEVGKYCFKKNLTIMRKYSKTPDKR